jgi:hypothetical protein
VINYYCAPNRRVAHNIAFRARVSLGVVDLVALNTSLNFPRARFLLVACVPLTTTSTLSSNRSFNGVCRGVHSIAARVPKFGFTGAAKSSSNRARSGLSFASVGVLGVVIPSSHTLALIGVANAKCPGVSIPPLSARRPAPGGVDADADPPRRARRPVA